MSVAREVILDLLPVYLAGEASPATRTLVEEHIKQDVELAARIRRLLADDLAKSVPPALPPEVELRSLRRTRRLLSWQRWVFGLGIFFSVMLLSNQSSCEGGHLKEFHFLLHNYPTAFGLCLVLGLACWIVYFSIRHHLRSGAM